jgi:hypothetical protein
MALQRSATPVHRSGSLFEGAFRPSCFYILHLSVSLAFMEIHNIQSECDHLSVGSKKSTAFSAGRSERSKVDR